MKEYAITAEEYEMVKSLSQKNRDKNVERRLQAIILRYERLSEQEIGERLGYARKCVSRLCVKFKQMGAAEYARNKYGGNHRNMSMQEEEEILQKFQKKAQAGQVITVKEIRAAFDERLDRNTREGYIYDVLKRHRWRKAMPRPQHPKKASEEEIESSKKLTIE